MGGKVAYLSLKPLSILLCHLFILSILVILTPSSSHSQRKPREDLDFVLVISGPLCVWYSA